MEGNGNKKKFVITGQNPAWGLTAFVVICMSILFYLVLTKLPTLRSWLGILLDVLMPIIIGTVMAYLLIPVYNGLRNNFSGLFARMKLSTKAATGLSKVLSTSLSLLLLIVVVVGLVIMAGPQVLQSIVDVAREVPSNIDKLSVWLTELLRDYPEILSVVTDVVNNFETSLLGILTDYVMPSVNTLITGITVGVINALSFMFDIIIGLIVCIYVLNSKDTFAAQSKKLMYGMFDTGRANTIIDDARSIHRIFSGFISGKLIDSLIIGMITFVALSIMNMPYGVMVSVIVGVTNVIPFFGPFIGAIPSAVIIFTESPVKSLYFVIYIIIIQQIDGNIIGPKILGNSTGLPSFWVLFSILVGGGLFGFAGMLLGVPVFATICMFLEKGIGHALERRGLPAETERYADVESIDPSTLCFVSAADSTGSDHAAAGSESADSGSEHSEYNEGNEEKQSNEDDI